jgi:hypothetical protein
VPGTAPQNFTEGQKIMRQNILRMIFCLAVVFVSLLVPCRVSAQAVTTYPAALQQALPDQIAVLVNITNPLANLELAESHISRASHSPGQGGDGLVVVQNESAYRQVVREEGNGEFLRRTFVARAGRCAFTPAATIAAVQTLLERLATGKWPDVDAASLNSAATALGPNFNIFATSQGAIVPVVPAFVDFKPSAYLRPFDTETEECDSGRLCSERGSFAS